MKRISVLVWLFAFSVFVPPLPASATYAAQTCPILAGALALASCPQSDFSQIYGWLNANLDSTNFSLTRGLGANYITSSGSGVTGAFQAGSYSFTPSSSSVNPLTVNGVSGQSADIFDVKDSAASPILQVLPSTVSTSKYFTAGPLSTALSNAYTWGANAGGYNAGSIGSSNSVSVNGVTGNNALVSTSPAGYGTMAIDYSGNVGVKGSFAAGTTMTSQGNTIIGAGGSGELWQTENGHTVHDYLNSNSQLGFYNQGASLDSGILFNILTGEIRGVSLNIPNGITATTSAVSVTPNAAFMNGVTIGGTATLNGTTNAQTVNSTNLNSSATAGLTNATVSGTLGVTGLSSLGATTAKVTNGNAAFVDPMFKGDGSSVQSFHTVLLQGTTTSSGISCGPSTTVTNCLSVTLPTGVAFTGLGTYSCGAENEVTTGTVYQRLKNPIDANFPSSSDGKTFYLNSTSGSATVSAVCSGY